MGDITWTEIVHMSSQILISRQNMIKGMVSKFPALCIYILIFLYTASLLLDFYAVIWEVRFLNLESEHLQAEANPLLRLEPCGRFDSLLGLSYLVS